MEESMSRTIDGPKPHRAFVSSEDAAKWIGITKAEFHAWMRKYLPTVRPVRLSARTVRWCWLDVAILHHVVSRSSARVETAPPKERRKKNAPPPPMPAASDLPDRFLPVYDQLTTSCDSAAIYFLLRKKVVVYVGSSASRPVRRVMQHKHGTRTTAQKDFDLYLFYPVPLDNMLQAERNFVALFDPEYNRNLKLGWDQPERQGGGGEPKKD